jgi:hypothetical protein
MKNGKSEPWQRPQIQKTHRSACAYPARMIHKIDTTQAPGYHPLLASISYLTLS